MTNRNTKTLFNTRNSHTLPHFPPSFLLPLLIHTTLLISTSTPPLIIATLMFLPIQRTFLIFTYTRNIQILTHMQGIIQRACDIITRMLSVQMVMMAIVIVLLLMPMFAEFVFIVRALSIVLH